MAKGIEFPESNHIWHGWPADEETGREEVYDLHTWISPDHSRSISCWKLTWRERLYAFFRGHVWLTVVGRHPPVCITAEQMFRPPKEGETIAPDGSVVKEAA